MTTLRRRLAGRGAARPFLLSLLAAALVGATAAVAQTADLPRTPDGLARRVRAALAERDMAAFEQLINWDGARGVKRRIVSFQVRHGFGRPIRSVAVEPFPEDGLRKVEARGSLKANMPVSHRLRVVFDEPVGEHGRPPTELFLVGQADGAFRIALVVRDEQADDD